MIETKVVVPMDSVVAIGNPQVKVSVQCLRCLHWCGCLKCKAFPEGIPYSISSGRFNHNISFEGDSGIRFKPKQ